MNNIFKFLIALIIFSGSIFANFLAFVDKQVISHNEEFNLTLQFTGQTDKDLDLSPLKKDFEIISQSTEVETSFINGAQSNKKTWIITLLPKILDEKLVIPSISLGSYKTGTISIKQVKDLKPITAPTEKVFIEVKTDIIEGYVKQEFILEVLIKSEQEIHHATLTTPNIDDDGILENLTSPPTTVEVVNGKRIFFTKRRYAFYPKRPGEIIIPSFSIEGKIFKQPKAQMWPGFLGRGARAQRVFSSSEQIKLKVKDIPDSFPKNQPFIAAKNLTIIESVKDDALNNLKVGSVIERLLTIKAKGVPKDFLPTLTSENIDGLKEYTDQKSSINYNEEDGIVSKADYTQVYIVEEPGEFNVKESHIFWWDTHNNKLQKTTIRPLSFTSLGKKLNKQLENKKNNLFIEQVSPNETVIKNKESSKNYWPLVSAILVLLWIATLIVSIILIRKSKKSAMNEKANINLYEDKDLKLLKDMTLYDIENNNYRSLIVKLNMLKKKLPKDETLFHIIKNMESAFADHKDLILLDKDRASLIKLLKKENKNINDPLPKLYS